MIIFIITLLVRHMLELYRERLSLCMPLKLFDQLLEIGIKFNDDLLELLLSLPQSRETFKVYVISTPPNSVISLQMKNDIILNEDIRRKA
ncbi:hypothetical protein CR513_43389, partial [Mucuna pruriens]